MFRKLSTACSCLLLFCAGWAVGQGQAPNHPAGGSTWKIMPTEIRTIYLAGFMAGYQTGALHAGALAMEKYAPATQMTPAQKSDYENLNKEAKVASAGLFHGDVNALKETVTAFYGDYRNAPVCVQDAIVFSVMSLAGNPPTEQELDATRRTGAQIGCK